MTTSAPISEHHGVSPISEHDGEPPSQSPFDPAPYRLDLACRLALGVELLHVAAVDQGIGERGTLHDRRRADGQLGLAFLVRASASSA